jgi:protein-S-isoprenylcysteine O-methyltransferase Ste14
LAERAVQKARVEATAVENHVRYLFIKALGGLLYIFVSLSALIFLSAWTLNYWQAWTFLAVFMVSITGIFIYLAKNDPDLLGRRIKTTEKTKTQTIIRLLANLTFTVVIVVSVLDHRFAWSTTSSRVVIFGDALVMLGMLIIFLVFKENTFTAQTVEVVEGQKVISTGPYALVRHPMYVGGLIFGLGIPLALGSWWGLFMLVLFTPVMAWRILDEEKLLASDLMGYAEYRNKVKYRMVPFVW